MSEMYVVYANNTSGSAATEDPLRVTIEDVKPVVACRCCLVTDQPLRPLDHKLVDAYNLLVSPMDQSAIYPKFICTYCSALLRKFVSFREKCLFSQTTLKTIHSTGVPITLEILKSCFLIISPYPLKVTETLVIHLKDDKSSPTQNIEKSSVSEKSLPMPTQSIDKSCASNSVVQKVVETNKINIKIKEENIQVEMISDDELFIFTDDLNASKLTDTADVPDCVHNVTTKTYEKNTKQNEYSGKLNQVKPQNTQQINEEHYSASDIEGTEHVDISIDDIDSNVNATASAASTKIEKPLNKLRKKIDTPTNRERINVRYMRDWIKKLKSAKRITSDDDDTDDGVTESSDKVNKSELQELQNWAKTAKGRKEQNNIKEQIMALFKNQKINEKKNTDMYKNAKYKCELCFNGFFMKVAYENHMARHKPAEGHVMCKICKKYYLRDKPSLRCLKNVHSDDYICEHCHNVSKSGNVKWRNRKHARRVGFHTEDQMKKALDYVKVGISVRRAAAIAGLSYTTLQRYVTKIKNNKNGIVRLTPNYSVRSIFTDEQEQALNEYFMNFAIMFYELTPINYRTVAYEMAIRHNVKVPDRWKENQMAGKDWLRGFRKRFPNVYPPQRNNSTSSDKEYIDRFYNDLQNVLSRTPEFADGTRIYNLDENVIKIASSGQKNISSGKEEATVTTCNIISAGGQALPPVFVVPSANVSEVVQSTPPGSLTLAASSGSLKHSLFPDVMKHFVKHTGSTMEHPTLLLMDNHESHLSIEALHLAMDAGVTILTLHQRTSDRLQPLEVGIYEPFKSFYSSAIESWMKHHPKSTVTMQKIGELLSKAFDKAMTPTNIKSAFKKTGIFPFDRIVLSEDESLSSIVTNKPRTEDAEQPIDHDMGGPSRTVSPMQIEEAGPTGLHALPLMNSAEPPNNLL